MITQRQLARKLAMIAIYQWQMTQNSYQDIYLAIQDDRDLSQDFRKCDPAYFQAIVRFVIENQEQVDALFMPLTERNLDMLDQIELAALRLAATELKNHQDVPYKVVVNESVNLTKKFGAEQAHKFVNGVVDKMARQIRIMETGGA
ncbi:MAG: transcription antitermination factor NusB [Proteobacteria bacterium]|nr:MAG: transcription antitermination factor NusB [Pseudomonadota bacterium]